MIYVVGAAEGIRKRFFMLIIAAGAAEDKFVGREVGQHQGARARARAITGAGRLRRPTHISALFVITLVHKKEGSRYILNHIMMQRNHKSA